MYAALASCADTAKPPAKVPPPPPRRHCEIGKQNAFENSSTGHDQIEDGDEELLEQPEVIRSRIASGHMIDSLSDQ